MNLYSSFRLVPLAPSPPTKMLRRTGKLVQSVAFQRAPYSRRFRLETLCSGAELSTSPTDKAFAFITSPTKETDPDMDKLCEILNRKKRHPSVNSVVEALNGCDSVPSNALVSRALKRFSNDWVLAFGVFTWAYGRTGYVHTPELYDWMVDVLGKCREFGLMWGLVDEMVALGGHVSLATMSKVMRRLCRAGMYDEAVDVFRSIEKFGVEKDAGALNVLMSALLQRGKVDVAHGVLLEFTGSASPDFISFNILISGYCRARMLDNAKRVIDEMKQQGFSPDVVSYTCLANAYCKMMDFEGVEATLAEMQEKGLKPSVVTYTTIMRSLVKENKEDEALEVCERMKRDCGPDASLSSSLILFLCRFGRHEDAWDAFQDMKKRGILRGSVTYNCTISSFCERRQEENALKLLQAMEEDSVRPNIKTYAPLLKMYCKLKRMKMIKYLLGHMSKNDVCFDLGTYSLLVHELCRAGKLKYAAFFFSEMVSKGMVPSIGTYDTLLRKLERENLVELKGKIEKLMLRAKERMRV